MGGRGRGREVIPWWCTHHTPCPQAPLSPQVAVRVIDTLQLVGYDPRWVHTPNTKGLPLAPRATRKLLCRGGGGDGMGAWRRRGGGRVPEMGFRAGPFVLCKDGCCHQRRRNTNFGPEQFFSRKNFPPHMCSQNDQRDVGIILSHVCWGWTPPPPPGTASRAAPAQTPLPARRPRRGRGGWANGLPCHPPPPPQSNFLPAQPLQPWSQDGMWGLIPEWSTGAEKKPKGRNAAQKSTQRWWVRT